MYKKVHFACFALLSLAGAGGGAGGGAAAGAGAGSLH